MLFAVQFAIVLLCILVGAQVGGIGLGVFGGLGLAVLTFGFGLQPTSPPIDVMLMIMAVVSAAAAMQASGGLDYMIKVATRILRRNPKHITFIAPMVTYLFTVMAGTGHVAYSVLPVIAEVSRRNGIRPERPLSMAVIASQFAIIASPIAAAVVATVATLFPIAIKLGVPAPIIIGTFVAVNGYFFVPNYGPIIAAIDFDTTGTTKIGKFIFNHSFMIPGLLSLAFSLVFELALAKMLL